jgi:site-specific recombinase XerD
MVNSVEGRWVDRDAAILMSLLDTGAHWVEFCNMDIGDINVDEGVIHIRGGKGDKDRWVFFGRRTRRAIRKYLHLWEDLKPTDPLWINDYGERL